MKEGWVHVALFQMQTMLFQNVDVSEYMDPVLMMMWFMPVTLPDKVRGARGIWPASHNIAFLRSAASAFDYRIFASSF